MSTKTKQKEEAASAKEQEAETPETQKDENPVASKDDGIVDLEDASGGFGDKVASAIPEAVKKAVKSIAGEDCGCKERQDWLNKNVKFPYVNTKKGCMNEEQFKEWEKWKKKGLKKLDKDEQAFIMSLYNSVLGTNIQGCGSCSGLVWQGYISRIDQVFEKMKVKLKESKNGKKG